MDITEQTDRRLTLKAPTSRGSARSGCFIVIFGLVLFTGFISINGNHLIWHVIVPIACVLYGAFCIIPLHSSVIFIDKIEGIIRGQNIYLFGLFTRTKILSLAEVNQFTVRHISTFKWNPAAISYTFRSDIAKLRIKSDRLHFGQGVNKYDSRNSNEEAIAQFVSEFIGLPITTNDRMIDAKNTKTRAVAIVILIASGVLIGFVCTWAYIHLIKH